MIDFKGMIPEEVERKIKTAPRFDKMLSFLKPINRNCTKTRQRVICPSCGSQECFAFTRDTNIKCFDCGLYADAFKVVQIVKGVDYHDALLRYADGMNLDFFSNSGRRETEEQHTPKEEPTSTTPEDADFIELGRIEDCAKDFKKSNLWKYFAEVLGLNAGAVEETALRYGIGSIDRPKWRSDNNPALFPYADDQGRIYDAKVLAYHPDGHRVKFKDKDGNDCALMTTLRSIDSRGDISNRPLFGSHLAYTRQDFPFVAVVESEKTAMLMSLIMPRVLWLAAGSMHWITSNNIAEKLAPFKDCRIRFLPDRNAVEIWDEVAEAARASGYDCHSCRDLIEYLFPEDEGEKKRREDIGDAVEDIVVNPIFKAIGKPMQKSLLRDLKRRIEEALNLRLAEYLYFETNKNHTI